MARNLPLQSMGLIYVYTVIVAILNRILNDLRSSEKLNKPDALNDSITDCRIFPINPSACLSGLATTDSFQVTTDQTGTRDELNVDAQGEANVTVFMSVEPREEPPVSPLLPRGLGAELADVDVARPPGENEGLDAELLGVQQQQDDVPSTQRSWWQCCLCCYGGEQKAKRGQDDFVINGDLRAQTP